MTPPTKRQDDWAMEQARELVSHYVDNADPDGDELSRLGVEKTAQALRQARLSALEDAAKVAESVHLNRDGIFSSEQSQGAGAVAIRIRALADGGGKA